MSDMEKKSSAANVEVGSAADVDEVLKKYNQIKVNRWVSQ